MFNNILQEEVFADAELGNDDSESRDIGGQGDSTSNPVPVPTEPDNDNDNSSEDEYYDALPFPFDSGDDLGPEVEVLTWPEFLRNMDVEQLVRMADNVDIPLIPFHVHVPIMDQ